MTNLVDLSFEGPAAILTLNRPAALNALSVRLLEGIVSCLREAAANREIFAVILTGAGRGFCAGLDLKEMAAVGTEAFSPTLANDAVSAMRACPLPIIGAINGVAATGGFELALACDILIAADTAKFIDTHAKVGLVPGWGLSQRLPRLIGINRAREISFTGRPVLAAEAEAWGLVNRTVPADELLTTCVAMANDMGACDRETLIRVKRVTNKGAEMPLGAALDFERLAMDFHSAQVSGAAVGESSSLNQK